MTRPFRSLLFVALALGVGTGVASAQGEAPRIGIFDPESLWKLSEVGKQYNADLSAKRDQLQAEIDRKQAEIDSLRDKLRQQQASLSEDKKQQMNKDVQNKMIELNRMNDDATREMKGQLNEVQGRFQQMLIDTVEAFGKEKNYTLILNKGVIDYNSPAVDITQDLIAKFNDMHKPSAPAASRTPAKKPADKPKEAPRDNKGGR